MNEYDRYHYEDPNNQNATPDLSGQPPMDPFYGQPPIAPMPQQRRSGAAFSFSIVSLCTGVLYLLYVCISIGVWASINSFHNTHASIAAVVLYAFALLAVPSIIFGSIALAKFKKSFKPTPTLVMGCVGLGSQGLGFIINMICFFVII